jgi:hypothetical protein
MKTLETVHATTCRTFSIYFLIFDLEKQYKLVISVIVERIELMPDGQMHIRANVVVPIYVET